NGKEAGRGEGSKFVNIEIPGKLLRKGKNVITVRVANGWRNRVTFMGPGTDMLITDSENTVKVALHGEWKYNNQLEELFPEEVIRYSHYPGVLFNGMINPVLPYSLTGAIWYQGESNAGRAYQYRTLFPKMIEDWRVRWGQGYFPFLFVQLANFESRQEEPGESDWAELREAQLMTLKYPNTGMAVIIDIGEADDIHPRNKQDVGGRLYQAARKIAYGEDVVYSGPIYRQMKVDGDKIEINFNNTGSGLVLKNNDTGSGFAIAGEDKKFFWADVEIVNNKVVVSSEKVKDPVAVRYAWDKNPVCTLYNTEGLPASPFRTDSWKGITER
ncbi:MAG: sialate O-acetylesterase, partial [Cyclobacteriaceae bacterium]